MPARIDFAAVRDQASFSTILDRYGIAHESRRRQISVLCPFHKDTRPSLSVNLDAKVFNCFACDAEGDILDFVAKMEKVSIVDGTKLVADWFGIPIEAPSSARNCARKSARSKGGVATPLPERRSNPTASFDAIDKANKPRPYELPLDVEHEYLAKRGLTTELIETFGLGYCDRGFLHGRVAIPLHSPRGVLIGYAGRWASDALPGRTQKYLLPPGFKKRSVLFNYHRAAGGRHLVIVEGYWSVFRLHALSMPSVALMGRTLSEEQHELLRYSRAQLITVLLDGDEPGRSATEKIVPRLAGKFFVRAPHLPHGEAPDTVAQDLLINAVRHGENLAALMSKRDRSA